MSLKIYKAKAHSNIALIKYWGKKDHNHQWPYNDSLSMTLSNAYSVTSCCLNIENDKDIIEFEGRNLESDEHVYKRIYKHINFLKQHVGKKVALYIKTYNNFPHSCGIASSASGFAALTIACIAALTDSYDFEQLQKHGLDVEKLSFLSRLGSGSSCRSFWDGFVKWEATEHWNTQKSYQLFDSKHWELCDIVVVIDKNIKKISSTIGHNNALKSPIFFNRISNIQHRIYELEKAILYKDFERFTYIVETEAQDFHDIICSSLGNNFYFTDKTYEFKDWLCNIRQQKGIDVCYTWDAGPNVHVLTTLKNVEHIVDLIRSKFALYDLIINKIGPAPSLEVVEC